MKKLFYASVLWLIASMAMASGSNVTIQPSVTATGSGAVYRTLADKSRDSISVKDFGADTTGAASSVTAFQNAINATVDGKIQDIHVPRGTYLGDMTTLTYGTRTVVFDEEGGVTYTTAAPKANRRASVYLGDATRPWNVGKSGFASDLTDGGSTDRPTLRIVRDAGHTGGTTGGSVNASALSVQNTVGANVQNYENAIVGQVTSNLTQTVETPNLTVFQGTLFKTAASTGGFFGANFVARDQTKLGATNSKGSLIGMEVDGVASGPDASTSRVVSDFIARGYDASADGATSFGVGVRVRTANSGVLSAEPVNLLKGIQVTTGSIGTIATGISVDGFAASGSHIEIQGAGGSGIFKLGSTNGTNGNTVGQLNYTGFNDTSAKVTYANVMTQIGSNTTGSENGTLILQARRSGALTTEVSAGGGVQVGAPTGGAKGAGTLNVAGAVYENGTQVLTTRQTGYTAFTGTTNTGTAYATSTITLQQLAERVAALQAALTAHGLIGP